MKTGKRVLVKGIAASPGIAVGIARIFFDPNQAIKEFKEGQILVTSATDPAWTVIMTKASAIVTNMGGVLCHAAIVSRELGIPCVVGTINATERIKDGMKIIVDGTRGEVIEYEDK
jgi:pyruvate,water dikinase